MRLTINQIEMIKMLANGVSPKDISKAIKQPLSYVYRTLDNIRYILNANTYAHAVAIAIREKLVQ